MQVQDNDVHGLSFGGFDGRFLGVGDPDQLHMLDAADQCGNSLLKYRRVVYQEHLKLMSRLHRTP